MLSLKCTRIASALKTSVCAIVILELFFHYLSLLEVRNMARCFVVPNGNVLPFVYKKGDFIELILLGHTVQNSQHRQVKLVLTHLPYLI